MSAKHTPGPWRVKRSESKPAFNVVGTKVGCKYKIARCPYISDDDKQEAEANAKLIAAAPELLKALKLMLSRFKGSQVGYIKADYVKWLAQEVIKKATE